MSGALPRLLAIMGSGETSPTMVKTHRGLLGRLGAPPVPAVVLDTPFGFQANADDLTARAVEYFRSSVGQELGVAELRSAGGDALAYETMLARVREARYVFSGPGSPSYALRQWRDSPVPVALAEKLRAGGPGGCICFASAAALTLGAASVPVYEIYKAGEPPHWLEGLNLLAEAGLNAVVIPHFDNAEGGTHDTRFCYLGEQRLARMEQELPDETFVLGIDEHTAIVLDLDEGTATVSGLGTVTVRARGRSSSIPSGSSVAIAELAAMALERFPSTGGARGAAPSQAGDGGAPTIVGGGQSSSLLAVVRRTSVAFDAALAARDVPGAVRAMLELDEAMVAWSADSLQSDERDQAGAALRSMIVRLGELAQVGTRDPEDLVRPWVEFLLELRKSARKGGRYDDADLIRDRLVALGLEVNDAPEGTAWRLVT
ncbi:MAG TPA: hypothetical protein VNA57_10900 [Acidimicrobiales bacterium]|nr:hypothetical protein [Acidimicrobiales bacterium]